MNKKNILHLLIFLSSFLISAQKKTILFLDESNKKPIIGLQIFSENGSFIANSDSKGNFELDIQLLSQGNITSIIAYNTAYNSKEYKLNEVPSIVFLNKNHAIQLNTVLIKPHDSKSFFILKGYSRSWKLVNNKVVRYGDGIIEYRIPYLKKNKKTQNDIKYNIEKFITSYRTFMVDSIKPKSRTVNISFHENFFDSSLPKKDLLDRGSNYFQTIKESDSLFSVLHEGKKLGYAFYDKNKKPVEINVTEGFEEEEVIKFLIWKISGKYKDIEKWTGEGDTRHLSYLFKSTKIAVKTKVKGMYNAVETINEIFIDDIIYDDEKPPIYKSFIDKDRSFYNSNFWDEQLLKHPLPSEIKSQLTKVNENKND